jgi:hypothetical protein
MAMNELGAPIGDASPEIHCAWPLKRLLSRSHSLLPLHRKIVYLRLYFCSAHPGSNSVFFIDGKGIFCLAMILSVQCFTLAGMRGH